MDWWYKNEQEKVNPDNKIKMRDAVVTVLRDGSSLARIQLFYGTNHFFIKTTNKIVLSHFLFKLGFEEIDEDEKPEGLELLFEAGV